MNIFILDTDPAAAAKMQCDKHVVKMVLESAQMLSTLCGGPYKPTHAHHPCTVWAGQSCYNFLWLWWHAMALAEEYEFRYDREHRCKEVILECKTIPSFIQQQEQTPFALAMPDVFKCDDAVQAYRAYYKTKSFAAWNRGRPAPFWWS